MFYQAALFTALSAIALTAASCSKASDHADELHSAQERSMTLGIVQKEIRPGMDQGSVATALGSPNIVTKDQEGAETWIYDKVASEVSYSNDEGGIWLIIAGYGKNAGARAKTQKTLTVVIKFDAQQCVDKVSYHSSTF